jgi:hypothetical protein
MSFWAATVITNLFSAIPGVGYTIVTWLWGGYAVGNPTLNRFFSLHYLLPFLIVGVTACAPSRGDRESHRSRRMTRRTLLDRKPVDATSSARLALSRRISGARCFWWFSKD